MKDKVSPMRDSSARSGENLPATGDKLGTSSERVKPGTPKHSPQEDGDTAKKFDNDENTEALKITDMDAAVSGVGKSVDKKGSCDKAEATNALQQRTSETQITVTVNDNTKVRSSKPEISIPVPKKNSKGFLHGANNWSKLRTIVKTTSAVKSKAKRKGNLHRQDSFLKKFSTRQQRSDSDDNVSSDDHNDYKWRDQNVICAVIHPDGTFMFYWLAIVTLAVLYNWWTCIAREGFREIQDGWEAVWFTFDAVCDAIYILDIVVQFRTGYLEQGLMVYDGRKLRQNYYKSSNFYLDIISLFPLDLLQIFIGIHPMIRFPRFLKTYRTLRFMYMLESRAAYPNLFRVANLTHLLFLGSHWFAAFYYLISEAEGFVGDWAYPYPSGEFASVTRKYLMSLYWSTLTLTTIGDLPPPDSNWEYVFVIVSYLIGVFVFATIVGQVGNVITNRNASRQEFEKLLDGAKSYMRMHNVPPDLQKRVQRWYDYVWSRGRLNGSWDINSLGLLPDKLKTELALHVNLETLKKVTIFQECQPEFLHDLVLKMKAYIFTPGDLICRSGEIAREMFIIADGVVEVISESGTVLTQMSTGDFFGEIGILNLDGGINRRTADVRSVGYSELFVLSREDVLSALKDHPDAEKIIRDYGQQRLQEIEADRQKIKAKPESEDDEEDAENNDDEDNNSFLSPLGRHVHFNSYSPMAQRNSPALLEAKEIERRKSCSVEYYRPKPVNGLVNFLQRKLSAGSAFCGMFQNQPPGGQNRAQGNCSAGQDLRRRTSSLTSSVDSIAYDRDSNGRSGILPKHLEISETRPVNAIAPPKHGFKGVHYTHIGTDEISDSESSVHGNSFTESYKLLPVEESVLGESSPTSSVATPVATSVITSLTADGLTSPSANEVPFPCFLSTMSTNQNSAKIASAFLHHLVNSQKLRRKSHDGRLPGARNNPNTERMISRRKTVYDEAEESLPLKTRVASQTEAMPIVPSLTIESDHSSAEEGEGPGAVLSDSPNSLYLSANDFCAPCDTSTVHNTQYLLPDPSLVNFTSSSVHPTTCSDHSQVGASMGDILRGKSASSGSRSAATEHRSQSDVATPKKSNKVVKADERAVFHRHSSPSRREFRVEQLMGDVQDLIVQRLTEIAEGYMSKVKLLEDDNLQKDDRIQELEMKIRDLQIELSMAYRTEKS